MSRLEPFVSDPELSSVNDVIAGGSPGPKETVKRAIIEALRTALTGTSLPDPNAWVHVDMEYPLEKTQYPAVWVQFSMSELKCAGVGHELMRAEIENEGTERERINWEPMQEWFVSGRVTLTVLSETSLERDRIMDALIVMLSFSRPPQSVLTDTSRDTQQFRQLLSSLERNPYIRLAINLGQLQPGGESVTPGVPWDAGKLAYEDSVSFEVLGQYNIVFLHDGTWTLRAIEEVPVLNPDLAPDAWR